jgi:uncharacterized membrane protein
VSPRPFARFDRLDALRGAAIVWMALYHFAFDLNFYGFIEPRQHFFRDPLWTLQRTFILSGFLLCAGAALAVALDAGQTWSRFWRRWAQVAGCALAVSLGSSFMFPNSWIAFGVLHGIAVMLIGARLLAPLGGWLWPLAAGCIALPALWRHPVFDLPWLSWIGLVTRKPITEDWVPVLPWFGVMLAGLAGAQWLLARRRAAFAGPVPAMLLPLATLGRWSLSFYMLHQPLLIGGVLLYLKIRA